MKYERELTAALSHAQEVHLDKKGALIDPVRQPGQRGNYDMYDYDRPLRFPPPFKMTPDRVQVHKPRDYEQLLGTYSRLMSGMSGKVSQDTLNECYEHDIQMYQAAAKMGRVKSCLFDVQLVYAVEKGERLEAIIPSFYLPNAVYRRLGMMLIYAHPRKIGGGWRLLEELNAPPLPVLAKEARARKLPAPLSMGG